LRVDFVIGVGSNLGTPSENLARGLSLLAAQAELAISALSYVYETEPLGPPQPRYLNAAVRLQTQLDAHTLLDRALSIERALGRVRDVRWGPRTLDLDLLWAERPFSSARLRVPHPHLHERTFALAPLLDVAPELAAEYGPLLTGLGGAPARWGHLSLHAGTVVCAHSAV
jgi:2-amino-4-hydroxy-6-hydroxymethyldihydropteridine diphosphokinase